MTLRINVLVRLSIDCHETMKPNPTHQANKSKRKKRQRTNQNSNERQVTGYRVKSAGKQATRGKVRFSYRPRYKLAICAKRGKTCIQSRAKSRKKSSRCTLC